MRRAILALSMVAVTLISGASRAIEPNPTQGVVQAMPLVAHTLGQSIMTMAMLQILPDVRLTFLNKTYENDVYVRDPITGKKHRVSCVRFRATSGFTFRMDPPTYSLTSSGLTVTQNFSRIHANGLTAKIQLGPCADSALGFGVLLSDVKFVYKARPLISIKDDGCQVSLNPVPDGLTVTIGDLNVIGVQNDLDKLAKNAVREALNFTLDSTISSGLRAGLNKAERELCGGSGTQQSRS